jgi:hypothetical protein
MKRKTIDVTCKICGNTYKTVGMATHIKQTHGITVESYVEKHGEYRKKYLSYDKRASDDYKCEICGYECTSVRHLSFHVKTHGITKKEYVLKYKFNNVHPTCECGCGRKLPIFGYPPYTTRFITGHNVYMHLGMTRSVESKMRMREAAINRIKNEKGVFFYNGTSAEEIKLADFIKDNYDGTIIRNDTTVLSGKELDIYLPDLKLAIELNGDRFHSDLYKDKLYHLKKTTECNDKGIHLIHIWMCDWMKKQDIIKSIILNKLGVISTRIYARNTEVREITNKVAQTFLSENHLQGQSISNYRYGLFYKDELVQVMTFSKLRHATGHVPKENSYELVRMCSKLGLIVVGGSNKLLKHFIKIINPKTILSYANRDWASGDVYKTLGFNFIKHTPPGYFYTKSKIKYHRYKFQKHKLVKAGYDKNKTEYQIMTERGFYKIWDCGNMRYELKIN